MTGDCPQHTERGTGTQRGDKWGTWDSSNINPPVWRDIDIGDWGREGRSNRYNNDSIMSGVMSQPDIGPFYFGTCAHQDFPPRRLFHKSFMYMYIHTCRPKFVRYRTAMYTVPVFMTSFMWPFPSIPDIMCTFMDTVPVVGDLEKGTTCIISLIAILLPTATHVHIHVHVHGIHTVVRFPVR